ncbi:MAG: TetR/AcrR family transcriptional regulator [Desulfobacterales bacterium]|nr:TetR/AcrR family transcriptional regulator [Desulfobacterales bacterium]
MNQTTQERIIAQAIACIAQNSGASMDEIAKAAGVGRATLFRHFKSRAELMLTIKLNAGLKLQAAAGPVFEADLPAREKLVKIITRLIPLGASLNVSAYFVHPVRDEDPRVLAPYLECMERTRQLCLDLKAEGDVQPDVPVSWLVTSIDSLIFAAWEKVESGDIAPKQAPWLVLSTFLTGHGTPKTTAWFSRQKDAHQ